jgi:hypothetical protein
MLEVVGEILELLFDIVVTLLHNKAKRSKGGDTTERDGQNTMASGVPAGD